MHEVIAWSGGETNKIIEMVDCVMFLNRKDILAQFISLNKAYETGLWRVGGNMLKESNNNK